jgi:hypothetical protein
VGLLPRAFSAGGPAVRYEDFILLVMVGLALARISVGERLNDDAMHMLRALAVLVGGFALCAILSTVTSDPYDTSGDKGTFGYGRAVEGIKEMARLLKYLLVVIGFSTLEARSWRYVVGATFFVCVVLVTVQILQYLGIPGLNEWVSRTYMEEETNIHVSLSDVRMLDFGEWRSGSLLVNPNDLGSFLMLPFFLFVGLSVQSRAEIRRLSKLSPTFWMVAAFVTSTGILLTQSRAAILSSLFMVFVFSVKLRKRKGQSAKIGMMLVLVGLIAIVTWILTSIGSFQRASPSAVLEGFASGSIRQKMEWTILTLSRMDALQVVFGIGPSTTFTVDNELGYVVAWYGAVGMFLYVLFMRALYLTPRRLSSDQTLAAILETALVACLLTGTSGAFLLNNRIFPFYLALMTSLIVSWNEPTLNQRHAGRLGATGSFRPHVQGPASTRQRLRL